MPWGILVPTIFIIVSPTRYPKHCSAVGIPLLRKASGNCRFKTSPLIAPPLQPFRRPSSSLSAYSHRAGVRGGVGQKATPTAGPTGHVQSPGRISLQGPGPFPQRQEPPRKTIRQPGPRPTASNPDLLPTAPRRLSAPAAQRCSLGAWPKRTPVLAPPPDFCCRRMS